jgi:hypothetical protein
MGKKTGPKGAKNKCTGEREAAMKEMATQIEKAVSGAFEGDALAYLTSIYKNPATPAGLVRGEELVKHQPLEQHNRDFFKPNTDLDALLARYSPNVMSNCPQTAAGRRRPSVELSLRLKPLSFP